MKLDNLIDLLVTALLLATLLQMSYKAGQIDAYSKCAKFITNEVIINGVR